MSIGDADGDDDGGFFFDEALRRGCEVHVFAEVDHPSGMARLWTGTGEGRFFGEEWRGRILGQIAPANETTTLAIKQITLTMIGVPPVATEQLAERVRGHRARCWLAALKGRRVQGRPYKIVDAILDYQRLPMQDSGLVNIELIGNVGFWKSERASMKAWTHEQQQIDYPGDTGMSLMPELADKEVKWRVS